MRALAGGVDDDEQSIGAAGDEPRAVARERQVAAFESAIELLRRARGQLPAQEGAVFARGKQARAVGRERERRDRPVMSFELRQRHAAKLRLRCHRARLAPRGRRGAQPLEPRHGRRRVVIERLRRLRQDQLIDTRRLARLRRHRRGALDVGAALLAHDARHAQHAHDQQQQQRRARDRQRHAISPKPADQQLRPRITPRLDQLAGGEALEIGGQRLGRRVALLAIARGRPLDDGHQVVGRIGHALAQRRGRVAGGLGHDLARGGAGEGRAAGERGEQDGAERKDVGALVERLAARLLGRHVAGRADDRAVRSL